MTRITDIAAAVYIARHCTDPRCRKCAARARWQRRKGWAAGKTPNRKNTGRK